MLRTIWEPRTISKKQLGKNDSLKNEAMIVESLIEHVESEKATKMKTNLLTLPKKKSVSCSVSSFYQAFYQNMDQSLRHCC